MSLEEKLTKVKSPNLQNQQHTSVILSSIEDTLRDQNTSYTPTAYFSALLALLRQCSATSSTEANVELVTSTVYLLDLVTSHVPAPLLRAQFSQVLALLAPTLTTNETAAPLLRSAIGCLESLLVAQDSAAWKLPPDQNGPRNIVPMMLTLSLDGRPKIRKRSLEALTNVLRHPPPGPALDHPAADLCASISLTSLKEAISAASQLKKQRSSNDSGYDPRLMHALHLTKAISAASGGWSTKKIEPLVETLMTISKSTNDNLVMSAFEVFEAVFEGIDDELSSSKLSRLLDVVVELKPSQTDSQLLPPWIAVLSRGYQLASEISPEDVFTKLPHLIDMISPFLSASSHNTRVSTSECLISVFTHCIPKRVVIEPSVYDKKIFEQLGTQASGLLSIKYQGAWMEVFRALSALIQAMRWRSSQYLLPIVKDVGELRGNDSFQGKKEADSLLGHAIKHMGPEAVLSVLPHNLGQDDNKYPGRAWLLPLLRDHVSNSKLAHFKSDLMPLSERLYQRVLEHGNAERTPRIKIYETVVHQVWATLPGYCDLPLDLRATVDQPFAEMCSNLLYKQTDLRGDLCRSLQNLVESNQAVLLSNLPEEDTLYERRTTKAEATKNVQHLADLSSNLLAVLFNVYSETAPQSRGYIVACINAYLSITAEQHRVETFNRVSFALEASLPRPDEAPPPKQYPTTDKNPPASYALLDLVIAISIYLPSSTLPSLFNLASRILIHPTFISNEPQLIKKAYKLIPRLATSSAGATALQSRNSELQSLILATRDKTPIPARHDRLLAIHTLVTFLPTSDLHFIPSVLSEVVLACKDANKRARESAFNLLLHVTNRLTDSERNPPGTAIKNRLVPHMPDDAPDASATLEEVFTMVSAGLAGVAPHMVAATVIALARLLFEFHSQLSEPALEDVVGTVELFLQSYNREIVRAVLGFVKVAVVLLPAKMLGEDRMKVLLSGCMLWSKENKGRMRMKVKGILERCLRRFGMERMGEWIRGDDSGRKMLGNIRKRKERTKRKKNAKADDEMDLDDKEDVGKKREFNNEFDEAVYGSDDDSDFMIGSDEGEEGSNTNEQRIGPSFKKGASATTTTNSTRLNGKDKKDRFIRADDVDSDDEPLDLLGPNALASISSRKTVRFDPSDQANRKAKVRMNENGKLVFGPGDADDRDGDVLMADASLEERQSATAVNAYIDAIDGPDAVKRGQKGRLKVGSGNQKKPTTSETMRRTGIDGDGARGNKALDEEEARKAARGIMRNSQGNVQRSRRAEFGEKGKATTRGRGKLPQRRGLGIEKQRGTNSRGGPLTPARGGRAGKIQKRGMLVPGAQGRGRGRGKVRSGG